MQKLIYHSYRPFQSNGIKCYRLQPIECVTAPSPAFRQSCSTERISHTLPLRTEYSLTHTTVTSTTLALNRHIKSTLAVALDCVSIQAQLLRGSAEHEHHVAACLQYRLHTVYMMHGSPAGHWHSWELLGWVGKWGHSVDMG